MMMMMMIQTMVMMMMRRRRRRMIIGMTMREKPRSAAQMDVAPIIFIFIVIIIIIIIPIIPIMTISPTPISPQLRRIHWIRDGCCPIIIIILPAIKTIIIYIQKAGFTGFLKPEICTVVGY